MFIAFFTQEPCGFYIHIHTYLCKFEREELLLLQFTFQHKIKSLLYVTTGAFGAFSAISIYRGNEKFFDNIVMPLMHTLNPETSHKIAIIASKYGLFSRSSYKDPVTLVRYSLLCLLPFKRLPRLVSSRAVGLKIKVRQQSAIQFHNERSGTGHDMAHVVNCWPLTSEAQVQLQASPCRFCGGQSGTIIRRLADK
jgi:hypothetical protein